MKHAAQTPWTSNHSLKWQCLKCHRSFWFNYDSRPSLRGSEGSSVSFTSLLYRMLTRNKMFLGLYFHTATHLFRFPPHIRLAHTHIQYCSAPGRDCHHALASLSLFLPRMLISLSSLYNHDCFFNSPFEKLAQAWEHRIKLGHREPRSRHHWC